MLLHHQDKFILRMQLKKPHQVYIQNIFNKNSDWFTYERQDATKVKTRYIYIL